MSYFQCEYCRRAFPKARRAYHYKECRSRRLMLKRELAQKGLNVIERLDDGTLNNVQVVDPVEVMADITSANAVEVEIKKKRGRPKGKKNETNK